MLSLGQMSKGKRLERKDRSSHSLSLSMYWCVLPVWEYPNFVRSKIHNGGSNIKNNQ